MEASINNNVAVSKRVFLDFYVCQFTYYEKYQNCAKKIILYMP